jgi:ADP-heptose:LPS heptosyltransferase
MTEAPENIKTAVLFYNGIGNFIMATPFLQNLNGPEIFLLQSDPRSKAVQSISLWPTQRIDKLKRIGREFDRIYILWAFPRSVAYPWMLAEKLKIVRGSSRTIVRQATPEWESGVHETDTYYSLLDRFEKKPSKIRTVLPGNFQLDPNRRYVGLCNGSDNELKRWPVERWSIVAKKLVDEFDVHLLYFGSESEAPRGTRMGLALGERFSNLAGKLTFAESAGLVEKCELMISNDTAIMHAADAVGTPVIALWGPSLWSKCRPVNGNAIQLQGACDRAPCWGQKTMEVCRSARCMETITADRVFGAACDELGQ